MLSKTYINILTLRSPDMLAPAKIPVAAGKNTANTLKNSYLIPSDSLYSGNIFCHRTVPKNKDFTIF